MESFIAFNHAIFFFAAKGKVIGGLHVAWGLEMLR